MVFTRRHASLAVLAGMVASAHAQTASITALHSTEHIPPDGKLISAAPKPRLLKERPFHWIRQIFVENEYSCRTTL
jgi:hypothetical protein